MMRQLQLAQRMPTFGECLVFAVKEMLMKAVVRDEICYLSPWPFNRAGRDYIRFDIFIST